MRSYDIIIIGAGASGVFMSYELAKLNVDADILMIDKGERLEKRLCPIKAGAKNCLKCSPCHIMNGSTISRLSSEAISIHMLEWIRPWS